MLQTLVLFVLIIEEGAKKFEENVDGENSNQNWVECFLFKLAASKTLGLKSFQTSLNLDYSEVKRP